MQSATDFREDVELTPETVGELLREHGIVPPALSTNGGRRILRELSAGSGITEGGEYLKPHGARRGLGHQLYQQSSELAQEALRHKSIETTHSAYTDVKASRVSESVSDALDKS